MYPSAGLFATEETVCVTLQRVSAVTLSSQDARERYGLTSREMQVALLLARGHSNRDIATELAISPHTAQRHTERVLEKLGVHSRAGVGARLRDD